MMRHHQQQPGRASGQWSRSLLCGILLLLGVAANALGEPTVHIGVLAKRGPEIALQRWQPTADYLNHTLIGQRFVITPLDFHEILPAIAGEHIDFILANPAIYVELEVLHGVSRIATLENRGDTNAAYPMFGGVIFTLSSREDIQGITDLRGKRLGAVEENSLGGYLMALGEMHRHDIDEERDLRSIAFAGTHDGVVYSVLDKTADVGTVRTDTLERMSAEGKIRLEDFRIIHPNPTPAEAFHYLHSTSLYPEWPFAKLRNTPNELTQRVATALLQMPAESPAAIACGCYGWTIPQNYQPVHDLLKELRVSPYQDYGKVSWQALLSQYRYWLIASLVAMLGMATVTTQVLRLNRRLSNSQAALQKIRNELELRVNERTADLTKANQNLQELSRDHQLILDSAGEGIYGIDADGLLTFINPLGAKLLGCEIRDLLGKDIHSLAHHSYPDGTPYPKHNCPTTQAIAAGKVIKIDNEVLWRKDGSAFPVEYTSTPIIHQEAIMGAVVVFRDVSERRKNEDRLRLTATVFESTTEGIIITDANLRIISVNDAFTRITGYSHDEAYGQSPALLKSGRHDNRFYEEMWNTLQDEGQWFGEIWNQRKNGELYPEWLNINVVKASNGDISHYVGVFSDITTIKQSEQNLEYLAHHDPLTELPNRLLFDDRLTHAITTARRQKNIVALLFLDLDRFKIINDTLGHQAGDHLLQLVAERLKNCLREQDTVARVGGDEFTIILESIVNIDEVTAVAKKIQETLITPFFIEGQQFYITTSIGISLYPDDGGSSQILIKNADTAMYRAKDKGRNNYEFYRQELTASAMHQLSMETGLRHALEHDEFVLQYQPQVALDSGKIVGLELLLRWQHPEHGLVMPDAFIPHAEETGLIVPIGEWVLRQTFEQYYQWAIAGLDPVPLAINLSSIQLFHEGFSELVTELFEQDKMPAPMLEMELTESQLMGHAEEAIELLCMLKDMGVRFAIDDFGTGYSSLSYLKRFPINTLKIDRTFIADLPDNPEDAEICKAIIALGRSLNLQIIAEGVETVEQLAFLQDNNCDLAQGILLGRPQSADDISGLLKKGHITLPR